MCKVALIFLLMVTVAISLTDPAFARNASPEDGAAQEVRFGKLIVTSPGRAYSKAQIVRNSHYPEPISQASGRLAGNSRRWGDASGACREMKRSFIF